MLYVVSSTKRTQSSNESWRTNFFQTWNGRVCSCSFEPHFHKTDEEKLWWRWLMHPNPRALASIAQNPISPLMELLGTAMIRSFFLLKLPKQIWMKVNGVQCKKNFQVSSTIDEDWWIWSFDCSWGFWWIWEVFWIWTWNVCILLWLGEDYEYIW